MTSLRILSFDPGTESTGYALGEGSVQDGLYRLTPTFGVLATKKKDGDIRKRIDRLGAMMEDLIKQHAPTHIVLEDFTEQGKLVGTTYKEMAWLLEHMRMVSRYNGFEATIYENAEWKRVAIGHGHVNKQQVQHFVTHKVKGDGMPILLGKKHPTHIWDSVGIGYAKFVELIKGGQ